MEMRYFLVGDKVAQDLYSLGWYPGQENLADYQSKHHPGEENSPLVLPRAQRPSTLKGCVGTLQDGYIHNVPLPRVVPREQSASPTSIAPPAMIPVPGYLQLPSWIPTLPRIGSVLGFSQRIL